MSLRRNMKLTKSMSLGRNIRDWLWRVGRNIRDWLLVIYHCFHLLYFITCFQVFGVFIYFGLTSSS